MDYLNEFEQFLRANKIKKKEMAEFFGVANSFITQLCDGTCTLPKERLTEILQNDKGWDTSMFIVRSITGDANFSQAGRDIVVEDKAAIDALNKVIEAQKAEIEYLRNLVDKLTNKA